MNHHLLPEVFVGGSEDYSSKDFSSSTNFGPVKKKAPTRLAPVTGLGLSNLDDDDYENSRGANLIDRYSKNLSQPGALRKHGQLAPMNFN